MFILLKYLVDGLLDEVVLCLPQVEGGALGLDEACQRVGDDVHEVDHAVLRIDPVVQTPEVVQAVQAGLENVASI